MGKPWKPWEKKYVWGCAIMSLVVVSLIVINGHSKAEQQKGLANYSLEIIAPDKVILIKVVHKEDENQGDYVQNLSDGLKEVSRSYEIEEVTPIISGGGTPTATTALIVRVKPK